MGAIIRFGVRPNKPPLTISRGRATLRPGYTFDYSKAKPNRFAGRMVDDVFAVILDPDVASVANSSAKANAMRRSVLATRPRKRSVRVRGHRRKAG
jgi:hypothetical protein